MKTFIFIAVVALAGFVTAEKYTDRYDNIDIDEILENRKLLIPYIKCMLDQGRCTADGRELKAHIKDAMQSSCSKCTDAQRKGSRKVVKHMRAKEPDYYKQLVEKYDPDNSLKPTYEAFLARDD